MQENEKELINSSYRFYMKVYWSPQIIIQITVFIKCRNSLPTPTNKTARISISYLLFDPVRVLGTKLWIYCSNNQFSNSAAWAEWFVQKSLVDCVLKVQRRSSSWLFLHFSWDCKKYILVIEFSHRHLIWVASILCCCVSLELNIYL